MYGSRSSSHNATKTATEVTVSEADNSRNETEMKQRTYLDYYNYCHKQNSSEKSLDLNVGFAPPTQKVQNRDLSEFGEELQIENDDIICLDIGNEGSAITTNSHEGAESSSADQDVRCQELSELRHESQERNIFEKIGRDDEMMESILQNEKEMEKEWEEYRRKLRAIMAEREKIELELDKIEWEAFHKKLETCYKAESVAMKIERAEKSLNEEKEGLRELRKELEELQKSNADARAAELDMSTPNLNESSINQVITPPQEAPEAADVFLAPAEKTENALHRIPGPLPAGTQPVERCSRGRPKKNAASSSRAVQEAPVPKGSRRSKRNQ